MGRKCPTGSWAKGLLVPTGVQSGCPLLDLRTSLERSLGLPWTKVMGLHIVSYGCVWNWGCSSALGSEWVQSSHLQSALLEVQHD